VSSGEEGFDLPSPRRRGTGAPPAPVSTTPWTNNVLATQVMMTVPPRIVAPQLDTDLPFEQCHNR
jgi:hypothetical protein